MEMNSARRWWQFWSNLYSRRQIGCAEILGSPCAANGPWPGASPCERLQMLARVSAPGRPTDASQKIPPSRVGFSIKSKTKKEKFEIVEIQFSGLIPSPFDSPRFHSGSLRVNSVEGSHGCFSQAVTQSRRPLGFFLPSQFIDLSQLP